MEEKRFKCFPYWQGITEKTKILAFCFHHAGGSAAFFYKWSKKISSHIMVIPIELPGHGVRIDDDSPLNWSTMITDLSKSIETLVNGTKLPFVLVGCSLGSLVAYCCAIHLEQMNCLPEKLIICAHCAPNEQAPGYKSSMGIVKLKAELITLGGMSEDVIDHVDFQNFYLPIIYRDYQFHDSYEFRGEILSKIPIYSFYGIDDPYFQIENTKSWKNMTKSYFYCECVKGNHFFVYDNDFAFKFEQLLLCS